MKYCMLACILAALPCTTTVNGQVNRDGKFSAATGFANNPSYNVVEYLYDACGNITGRKIMKSADAAVYEKDKNVSVQNTGTFTLTPNPTSGIFCISMYGGAESDCTDFKIFTPSGHFVTSGNMQDGVCRFDISSRQSGIYFVQTFYHDGLLTWKVVKQ